MRDSEANLRRIAREIDNEDLVLMNLGDWSRCVYQARIGVDNRTALTWLRVAEWAQMIHKKPTPKGFLIERGPEFASFANSHSKGGDEDAIPTHA